MRILFNSFSTLLLACLVILPGALLVNNTVLAATALTPEVARAQVTTGIKANREPADEVVLLANSVREVYYFNDLRNMSGKTITHRWEHNGEVVAEIPLKIKIPRERVHTKISLEEKQLGKWVVLVVDDKGWVLKATEFEYVPAALAR